MTYELRPALWEDNPFLEKLYADVHALEFVPLKLPAEALSQLVALKFKAERMAFAAQFPDADHSIVRADTYPIGRVLLHETASEVRLIDLALLSAFRGEGIGTSILEQLKEHANQRGLPLRLSVSPLNPAMRLFERLGFARTPGDGAATNMEWLGG